MNDRAINGAATRGAAYISRLAAVGFAAALISALVFCPQFAWWQALRVQDSHIDTGAEINRAQQVLKQFDDPFVKINDPSNAVIQWRLLFPIIGHYLHFPVWLFLCIPHIGCVVLLAYMAHLVRREGGTWLWAFCAAGLLATGSWFFVSTGWLSYEDSWSVLGMLLVACSPSALCIAVACLLEPFIDERFVLGLPLLFVLRQVFFNRYREAIDRESVRQSLRDAGLITASTAPYVLLRLVEMRHGDVSSFDYFNAHLQELRHLTAPFYLLFLGTWMGLRCGWALVIALVGLLFVGRRRKPAVIIALVVSALITFTIALSLVIASDIGRSASMLWPAAVVGLLLMIRVRPGWARYALPALMVANLILPAGNVIMVSSAPLRTFYAEWERYKDPRTIFHAANWLDGGKLLAQQNKLPEALHQLDIALQLDDRLVEGYVYRAVVNLRLGNIGAAAHDADAALALDPNSADALFVRGTIYNRQHDPAEAGRLFEQALGASPPDWHFRAECIAALKATKQ